MSITIVGVLLWVLGNREHFRDHTMKGTVYFISLLSGVLEWTGVLEEILEWITQSLAIFYRIPGYLRCG